MKTPDFWTRPGSALGAALSPLGCVYGCAGALRASLASPARVDALVLCIGNLTAGGAGKTPVVLRIGEHLGHDRLAFLSRGYGGRLTGPIRVSADTHSHAEVGDEPLLLARTAPTWVARDRAAGARAAVADGARVIVMDDGHQNPSLQKDISIVVIDGETGFGNGHLIPAGPLREPVARGLTRADAVVIVGDDQAGVAEMLPDGMPVIAGRIRPAVDRNDWAGRRVVAFAGIGRPEKFFASLAELGCEILARHAFADHHDFTPSEIARLRDDAEARNAALVTTEKDMVRLPPDLANGLDSLPVRFEWDDPAALDALLEAAKRAKSG